MSNPTIDEVFGDFNTPGIPSSGDKNPSKREIRNLLKGIAGGTAAVGDYRGAWSNATAYIATDLVERGGSIWYALVNNTNVTPVDGATWDLFLPGVSVADGAVTEAKVTATATDALRITISNLAYPKLADRSGDPAAANANRLAIQAALSSKRYVHLGEGDIRTNGKIVLAAYNRLMGCGDNGATRLTIHSTTEPCIEFTGLNPGMYVEDMQLLRVGVPNAAAHGISSPDYVDECSIKNVRVKGHYMGLYLRATGYSLIQNCFIQENLGDGIRMEPATISGACQWYIDGLLIQTSGGHGIVCQSVARGSVGQMAVGDWNNIRTFGNTGSAAALIGMPGIPIIGLRMRGGFLGGDGGLGELYLDTHGHDHFVSDVFMEYNRSGATGPGLIDPVNPANGAGVYVTPNNTDIQLSNCVFFGNKGDGLLSYATEVTAVDSCTSRYNTGYGMSFAEGNKAQVSFPKFRGNTVGDIFAATGTPEVIGAFPRSIGTRFMGGVALGLPTGGIPAPGSINISGNALKNNVVYTNP